MAVPAEELKRPAAADPPRVGADASVTALAVTGLRALTDLVGHFVELVALESRAAGGALAGAVGLALGIVVLGLTVWGLLIAAAVSALALHTGTPIALLMVAGVTLAAGGVLAMWLPRLLRRLTFPATRRMFKRGE